MEWVCQCKCKAYPNHYAFLCKCISFKMFLVALCHFITMFCYPSSKYFLLEENPSLYLMREVCSSDSQELHALRESECIESMVSQLVFPLRTGSLVGVIHKLSDWSLMQKLRLEPCQPQSSGRVWKSPAGNPNRLLWHMTSAALSATNALLIAIPRLIHQCFCQFLFS